MIENYKRTFSKSCKIYVVQSIESVKNRDLLLRAVFTRALVKDIFE